MHSKLTVSIQGLGLLPDVPDKSHVLTAIGIDKAAPFIRTSFYWFCFVTVMTLLTPYTLTSNKGSRKKILGVSPSVPPFSYLDDSKL